jgi:hypothetical protein
MSNLSRFMKQNKAIKENTKFAATASLTDEKGNPLEWEIKPLSTKDDERIKDACMIEVPVTGKPNLYRQKMNTTVYLSKMLVASVVSPDLNNAELQDSYGVKKPEELLKELIDNPGEYNEFAMFVQNFNGFNTTLEEKVEEAKN